MSQPTDVNVSIAVLYERLGHVMTRIDDLGKKLDRQEIARAESLREIDVRVAEIERGMLRARWFLAGIAAAGGAVGGSVAGLFARALGG